MPAYDAVSFDPPAPVARIILRSSETGTTSAELPAVLDTGADVTLLPQAAAAEIGVSVEPGAGYELAGFDGNVSRARSTKLDLILLDKVIRGRFLLWDQDYGILGRDTLNLFSLLLDGPRETWSGRFGSS